MTTYKISTTIGQKLSNYKDLALNKTQKQTKGGSRPCEPCALCGCYGKNNKSIVANLSQLLTKTKLSAESTFHLPSFWHLHRYFCRNANAKTWASQMTCVICHEKYVGHNSNKFS